MEHQDSEGHNSLFGAIQCGSQVWFLVVVCFFLERILVVNLFGNLEYGEIWRVNIFLKRYTVEGRNPAYEII